MDFNISDANFHYWSKELVEEKDSIMKDKVKLVRPDQNSLRVQRERIDGNPKAIDNPMAQKEEESNRRRNLRYGLEWKERKAVAKGSTSSFT